MTDQPPQSAFPPPPASPSEPAYTPVVVGRKGRGGRIGLVLAIVGVVIAAAFGFSAFSGSGDGAGSSEEAVRDLFDALANEDAIGVLEAFAPEERSVLRPTIEDLNKELQRLGIINEVDLSKVPGIEITVDGLEVASSFVADDISRVQLTAGTVGITTKPGSVPTGDVLRRLIEANGGDATVEERRSTTELGQGEDDYLVAVKRGGGWFVSLAFTIAEQVRSSSGDLVPTEAEAVSPIGAGSSEDAVRQFLDAMAALDVRGLIARTPPDEMRALQRYAPIFLPDAEGAIADFKQDAELDVRISDLDLTAADVDGGRLVQIGGGRIDVALHGGSFSFDSADDCITITPPPDEGAPERVCPGDFTGSDGRGPVAGALSELTKRFSNVGYGIVTVERDGLWFVSPLRTISNVVLGLLGTIERADLEEGGSLYKLFTGDFGLTDAVESIEGDSTSSFSTVGSAIN